MKNLISKTFLGGSAKVSLLAVIGILFFVVLGCSNLLKNKNISTSETPITNSSPPVTVATPKPQYTKSDASKAEMPSDPEIQDMAKTTLLDFNKAVKNEDFTDFHSNIANEWKKEITADEMKTTFQGFIDKKIDISDISSLDADVSPDPSIEKELGYKTLKIKGRYATSPYPTKFLLNFIPNGKQWKLSRIEVSTKPD
ncbi:MAG TPA: hypothetical protein VGC76_11280 [Pyrinomonadaceae bacterium]|jgi:hypothetical protein